MGRMLVAEVFGLCAADVSSDAASSATFGGS